MKEIIVALDVPTFDEAKRIITAAGDSITWYKVGLQLFLADGEKVLTYLKEQGKRVFLDLKFFDIPNTVESAVESAARFGVDMLTVHALGGSDMIARASYVAKESNITILAVTILTSVDKNVLVHEMGIPPTVEYNVMRLSKLATDWGAGGVVCSPLEARSVRGKIGDDKLIITPGVRMPNDAVGDQKRVTTPKDAFDAGANMIVMGRSITKAKDPARAIAEIQKSIKE